MKLKPFLTILCLSALLWSSDRAVAALPDRAERLWKARWISSGTTPEQPNTWLNYRYTADLPALPSSVVARIGADSKYWLWVNGRLVVFEGGLKRGPNPQDTYYDEVELAPYLVKGKNTIAVLLWYFGKPSFSHNDSGNYVTDGPFVHENKNGALVMLWSSFGEGGYTQGMLRHEGDDIATGWSQIEKPLYAGDGGHGMVFEKDGKPYLTLHVPNSGPEHAHFIELRETADALELAKEEK